MTDNLESQKDEILALKSIYNQLELKMTSDTSGKFIAHPAHRYDKVKLILENDLNIPKSLKHLSILNMDHVHFFIRHMPPIILSFRLPTEYPSNSCPVFSLSCVWLFEKQLELVKEHLLKEWRETKEVILFSWTSFLINDLWEYLNLCDTIFCKDILSPEIIHQIIEHDLNRQLFVFSQSPHKCNVCFEEFKGSICIQFLPCDHIFCKVCMKSYFEILINSGDVNKMLCPDDKCESIALPTQVKELVDNPLYNKYEQILLQRTLDQMSDVVRCPRKFCQNAILKDEGSNMVTCNSCNYIFCILCDKTWHGHHTPCEVESSRRLELYNKWKDSNDAEREAIYKTYGRSKVLEMVADVESAEWLKNNSKLCPSCKTPIQLGIGCNKVLCTICNKYMCWLCSQQIDKTDPYSHFRPGGPCENRLFENTISHDMDDYYDHDNDFDDDLLEIIFEDVDDL